MYDLHGLFNCLRPELPLGYNAFDVEDVKEIHECSVCPNQATREVKYLTPETGKVATLYVCDECFEEKELWEGRQIIKTIHL